MTAPFAMSLQRWLWSYHVYDLYIIIPHHRQPTQQSWYFSPFHIRLRVIGGREFFSPGFHVLFSPLMNLINYAELWIRGRSRRQICILLHQMNWNCVRESWISFVYFWKRSEKHKEMSEAAETLATQITGQKQGYNVHLLLPLAVFISNTNALKARLKSMP